MALAFSPRENFLCLQPQGQGDSFRAAPAKPGGEWTYRCYKGAAVCNACRCWFFRCLVPAEKEMGGRGGGQKESLNPKVLVCHSVLGDLDSLASRSLCLSPPPPTPHTHLFFLEHGNLPLPLKAFWILGTKSSPQVKAHSLAALTEGAEKGPLLSARELSKKTC